MILKTAIKLCINPPNFKISQEFKIKNHSILTIKITNQLSNSNHSKKNKIQRGLKNRNQQPLKNGIKK